MAANIYLLPSFHRLLIDHARIGMTFYRPTSNEMASNVSVSADQHDEMIAAIEAPRRPTRRGPCRCPLGAVP